jgi:hypothetical protein
MIRVLALALAFSFGAGFYAGASLEHRTCRAVETYAPWVAC